MGGIGLRFIFFLARLASSQHAGSLISLQLLGLNVWGQKVEACPLSTKPLDIACPCISAAGPPDLLPKAGE